MKRTPRKKDQPCDNLKQKALATDSQPMAPYPSDAGTNGDHETSWTHWTEEVEPLWTPNLVSQNQSLSMRPASKLKILRNKYQATQMQFSKGCQTERKPAADCLCDTVTDGLLKTERPITKQQPRLVSRNFRLPGQPPRERKVIDQCQRSTLSRMIQQALKKNDRTRPPTSVGSRVKSQSVKLDPHDELEALMPESNTLASFVNIPIKEMYRDKNTKNGQRRRSLDLDSIIRLNRVKQNRTVNFKPEPALKTSLGVGFLSLFANDF